MIIIPLLVGTENKLPASTLKDFVLQLGAAKTRGITLKGTGCVACIAYTLTVLTAK